MQGSLNFSLINEKLDASLKKLVQGELNVRIANIEERLEHKMEKTSQHIKPSIPEAHAKYMTAQEVWKAG